jgi:hypothetical protein
MASAGPGPLSARSGRRSRRASDAWTQPLWPLHLKPLPDELLSSWVVRLAHAHGLKVQTFSRLLGGSGYHIWNRDIDRAAPSWLIDVLCRNTATPIESARQTSLQSYEGEIYVTFHEGYVLPWILPLKIKRFTQLGHGLQFCPHCLAEDPEPYFRKRWRVAFYTWCSVHGVMLHDRCPGCGAPVDFQRRELGRPNEIDGGSITQCHVCDFDFRSAPAKAPGFHEESAQREFGLATDWLEHRQAGAKLDTQAYFAVLHHLCRTMLAAYRNVRAMVFACDQIGIPDIRLEPGQRVLEIRSIEERHHVVQLGLWYMADLRARLTAAWQEGAVTYSALLRDFEDRPRWYDEIVEGFSDWRARPKRHVQPRNVNGRFRNL